MQKSVQSTRSSPTASVNRTRELAFAGRTALYLEKQGLDQEAVIQCLIDELELDRETAKALATLAA